MSDPVPVPHQRELIRTAVVSLLTNRTGAGDRVQGTKLQPYSAKRNELPAIAVYTVSEASDRDNARAPRQLARELEVQIAAAAVLQTATIDPGKPLDALAKQIEAVIDADPFLGGAVGDRGAVLESTEVSFPDLHADPVIGIITLTYSVTYYTSPEPANLDDFITAGATTQIAGAGADNAAHDLIVVQETP
jgi:hypothetical protein